GQRDDRVGKRGRDALAHDSRADHRRDHEHVIAHARRAIGSRVTVEPRTAVHRGRLPFAERAPRDGSGSAPSSGGSASRGAPSPARALAVDRSPRPRSLATLCAWTCSPAAMSAVARPMGLPYFTTALPAAIGTRATLWPRGIDCRTVTITPPRSI